MGIIKQYKSKSYEKSSCCFHADCDAWKDSTRKKPCWGVVTVGDEVYDKKTGDCFTYHYCEGHWEEDYKEEPNAH